MLANRVVIITGGAGLLGEAFCRAAAHAGARVVVADVDATAAGRVAAGITAGGGSAEAAVLDITQGGDIDALLSRLHAAHGRIDAVVNNAYPKARGYGRPLESVEYADFCANVSAHLGGYFLVSQRCAAYFKSHGGGNIINMASIYGVMTPRFEIYRDTSMTMPVEYAAIKAGVVHLTRYFAQYFKKDGIRCNALAPGGVLNGQPAEFVAAYNAHCGTKGMLAPDDVIGALIFLLSDQSLHMTGQCLILDDGFSL